MRNRYGEVVDVVFEAELRELMEGTVDEAALASEARVSAMYEEYCKDSSVDLVAVIADACSEMEGRIELPMNTSRSLRLRRRRAIVGK